MVIVDYYYICFSRLDVSYKIRTYKYKTYFEV